jgi:hypothetical protein
MLKEPGPVSPRFVVAGIEPQLRHRDECLFCLDQSMGIGPVLELEILFARRMIRRGAATSPDDQVEH